MTVGLLHGSKSNSRENFLFNGLFKTPKFDLDQKLLHGSKSNSRENFLFNGLFKTPKYM